MDDLLGPSENKEERIATLVRKRQLELAPKVSIESKPATNQARTYLDTSPRRSTVEISHDRQQPGKKSRTDFEASPAASAPQTPHEPHQITKKVRTDVGATPNSPALQTSYGPRQPLQRIRTDVEALPSPPESHKQTRTPTTLTSATLSTLNVKRKPKSATSKQAPGSGPNSLITTMSKASIAGSQSPNTPTTATSYRIPEWYMKVSNSDMRKQHRQLIDLLQRTKSCIQECARAHSSEEYQTSLRQNLHKLLYFNVPGLQAQHWPPAVKASKILDESQGLPRVFANELSGNRGPDYAFDIKADAREIYNKWWRADFNINILRGIRDGRIDSNAKISWEYFGAGDLVNGQWWPTQLAAVRDGAHGSAQGGIAGVKEGQNGSKWPGAVSILLAGGYAEDKDKGEEIWYTGTEGSNFQPTENTTRLIESGTSFQLDGRSVKNPVRVLRSHNLGRKSEYTPRKGLRYDGLYEVRDWRVLNEEKAIHLFHLLRLPGQDPIRARGPEARPTDEEIMAYEQVREAHQTERELRPR